MLFSEISLELLTEDPTQIQESQITQVFSIVGDLKYYIFYIYNADLESTTNVEAVRSYLNKYGNSGMDTDNVVQQDIVIVSGRHELLNIWSLSYRETDSSWDNSYSPPEQCPWGKRTKFHSSIFKAASLKNS